MTPEGPKILPADVIDILLAAADIIRAAMDEMNKEPTP